MTLLFVLLTVVFAVVTVVLFARNAKAISTFEVFENIGRYALTVGLMAISSLGTVGFFIAFLVSLFVH